MIHPGDNVEKGLEMGEERVRKASKGRKGIKHILPHLNHSSI